MAVKSQPGSEPQRPLPPAHPRRPNRTLLVVSSAMLAVWILFLVLIAWRIV